MPIIGSASRASPNIKPSDRYQSSATVVSNSRGQFFSGYLTNIVIDSLRSYNVLHTQHFRLDNEHCIHFEPILNKIVLVRRIFE